MTFLRIMALAVPLVVAIPLGEEPVRPSRPPAAHAVDVWLGHTDSVDVDAVSAREALRGELGQHLRPARADAPEPSPVRAAAPSIGDFAVVGSVAVLKGDATTSIRTGTGFGVKYEHLAAVSRRFIETFGDHYNQIAVFLAFEDRLSTQALAYQLPIRNTTLGLGLAAFDASRDFGSAGTLETILNMKRILVYGRDAATDPDNGLYAVWAQEAAHRWVVYFRFDRDGAKSEILLGRQKAHWARGVQADASIMDGYSWRDNGDGTFTPLERGKRYGALDQYGMGLRTADEVPPFFVLEDLRNEQGVTVEGSGVMMGGVYKGRRTNVTIKDVVRAMGPRTPTLDPTAQDLRMGVVLLTAPGVDAESAIGESFRIDHTRRLWTEYYDAIGEGRGKVCTELLRPCRGPSFTYGAPTVTENAAETARDGVLAPGEAFTITLPVTNAGTERGTARVKIDVAGRLALSRDTIDLGMLAPGQTATLSIEGRVPSGTTCGQPIPVELTAAGRMGPSRGRFGLTVGLAAATQTFEAGSADWRVNPDGADTARAGAWELAAPERTSAFDFVLQPGGAASGSRAFVTGAAAGGDASTNDVDGGFTTLESPALPLTGLVGPRLSYSVFFAAADFDREVLIPAVGDFLAVSASVDGTTWTEIDRITGMALGWERRVVRLADVLPPAALSAPALRFRFVAQDAGITENVVEATIDDVAITSDVAACAVPAGIDPPPPPAPASGGDGGGGGCRVGAGGAVTGWPLAAVALALVLARRRRRR